MGSPVAHLCTFVFVLGSVASCGRVSFDNLSDPSGSSSSGSDGGGADDGGAGISACGSQTLLDDDFEDGAPAMIWSSFNDGDYTVSETNGALTVSYGASVGTTRYAGYSQRSSIDITGACMLAEILAVPAPSSTAYAYVRLGTSANKVMWRVQGGMLAAQQDTSATVTIGDVPFDPAQHRFLLIKQSDAVFEFATSATLGGPYESLGLVGVSTVSLASATVELGAATADDVVTNGGTVSWGRVFVGK